RQKWIIYSAFLRAREHCATALAKKTPQIIHFWLSLYLTLQNHSDMLGRKFCLIFYGSEYIMTFSLLLLFSQIICNLLI
ncbi:MAG: hypothetical protein FWC20_02735, partial [Oscillospiraceae bacterium]|nr:hypothetical protein [Oscillospiraceae bacterium]MCL2278311.1 hypothetical protein [Oscillospiraceae bacterium]